MWKKVYLRGVEQVVFELVVYRPVCVESLHDIGTSFNPVRMTDDSTLSHRTSEALILV